ncbi:ATP-binding protein [Methylomonas sp. AM2-LC]|uniref:ATP-binding protein n=1 Tax=Methylomonas sp. AM2-LC TaxID=3153301 RepID=UPI0032678181
MQRLYSKQIEKELFQNRQMLFVSGPRQVGKTTIARQLCQDHNGHYLNWDDVDHRQLILVGTNALASKLGLDQLRAEKPLIVFDELHKYRHWKDFLKGFYDRYEQQVHILVTGSARLDIFKKGGDSLMGRYFHLCMHPLTIGEICNQSMKDEQLIQFPQPIAADSFEQLYRFGGFPEPFIKANSRFSLRWQNLRSKQLIQEDIRNGANIQELAQLEILCRLLTAQAGQVTRYATLATQIRVSVDTIRRWLDTLESFYFCFRIRPWSANIASSLRKEPKTYLWDWSQITDNGMRAENFIASHLLKAVHWWNDLGMGDFGLYYLRTKDQKEVDFLITKNNLPWFLVEVKAAVNAALNANLAWFQDKTGAEHAFQVCLNMPFVPVDCFSTNTPIKVPAQTFLSQLI